MDYVELEELKRVLPILRRRWFTHSERASSSWSDALKQIYRWSFENIPGNVKPRAKLETPSHPILVRRATATLNLVPNCAVPGCHPVTVSVLRMYLAVLYPYLPSIPG